MRGRRQRGCPTLGDGSHSQGYSDLKVVDGTTDPGAPMHGVVEVANVDEPDSHADEGDDLGELLPKLIQLLLQRGLVLLCGGHLVTDLPNLGAHAGGGHNANGLAGCDVGALGRGRRGSESGDTPRAAMHPTLSCGPHLFPCHHISPRPGPPGWSTVQLALEGSPRKACSSYPG